MSSINMNMKWLGREEVPYECRTCNTCDAINWVIGFYPGQQHEEIDAIKCWKCGDIYWIDPTVEEHFKGNIALAHICHSVPDPVIPQEALESLLDAAAEQYEDMQLGVRSEEDDPELIKTIQDIGEAINYVKHVLAEGVLPLYMPPNTMPSWIKE